MPLFLCKCPLMNACVLELNVCPPHNLIHDITSYPLFYDPTPVTIWLYSQPLILFVHGCRWLQSVLVSHTQSCWGCRSSPHAIAVTWQASHINVSIDGTLWPFLPAYFESPRYSHCSIFNHHKTSQSNVSIHDCLKCNLSLMQRLLAWEKHHVLILLNMIFWQQSKLVSTARTRCCNPRFWESGGNEWAGLEPDWHNTDILSSTV
jgi:hypothetical protein